MGGSRFGSGAFQESAPTEHLDLCTREPAWNIHRDATHSTMIGRTPFDWSPGTIEGRRGAPEKEDPRAPGDHKPVGSQPAELRSPAMETVSGHSLPALLYSYLGRLTAPFDWSFVPTLAWRTRGSSAGYHIPVPAALGTGRRGCQLEVGPSVDLQVPYRLWWVWMTVKSAPKRSHAACGASGSQLTAARGKAGGPASVSTPYRRERLQRRGSGWLHPSTIARSQARRGEARRWGHEEEGMWASSLCSRVQSMLVWTSTCSYLSPPTPCLGSSPPLAIIPPWREKGK